MLGHKWLSYKKKLRWKPEFLRTYILEWIMNYFSWKETTFAKRHATR